MSANSQMFLYAREDPQHEALQEQYPAYPLSAPGMPLPGEDFVKAAIEMGDEPIGIEGKGNAKRLVTYGNNLDYLYRRALYDDQFVMSTVLKSQETTARGLPGHLWGSYAASGHGGPKQSSVMIIGKMPGQEELKQSRNLVGETSMELVRALMDVGVPEAVYAGWYVTNLVKWALPAYFSGALPQSWVKDWLPVLHQELRLVRPNYILCLGSDASKALLGKPYAVTHMVGRVVDLQIPLQLDGQEPYLHTARVMTVVHPAAVYRRPEQYDEMVDQVSRFWQLTQGVDIGGSEDDIEHVVVNDLAALRQVVEAGLAATAGPGPTDSFVAIDAEWSGDHPQEPGAYLRCAQFSYAHKQSCCVELRAPGGEPSFREGIPAAMQEMGRLFNAPHVRLGGHFLRADLPWFLYEGLDLRNAYLPHPDVMVRNQGGWDTGLAYHAYNETASYKLEDMGVRLTSAPRWDSALRKWKVAYMKANGIEKEEDLDGYGDCPSEVLYPYGNYDADVTRRIIVRMFEPGGLTEKDWFGNDSWVPYWMGHMASEAFFEMELNGMVLDRDRADELSMIFHSVVTRLLSRLRNEINWPDFNPNSSQQVAAFMFGDAFGLRKSQVNHGQLIRPEGAITLDLTPIKTTGKRAVKWSRVVAKREIDRYTPSTDKEVLGALGYLDPRAAKIRDLKFVTQVLKSALRVPVVKDGDFVKEGDNFVYVKGKGIVGVACADGRVRTHLFQTKETGRASSSRPPLQNLSKRREDDYRRILGFTDKEGNPKGTYIDVYQPLYKYPIRTILRASPGHVLVESDFTGAELALVAWMSQDRNMIEDVRRNSLPESDPDYYDIHSQTAVRAFQLPCEPTKQGLYDHGCPGLRVAAKNVNFGIPYGRGAEAIARQCAEEGTDVTKEQAEKLIGGYFERYPDVFSFLADARSRVSDPGWIVNCFNRYRRFVKTSDNQVRGDQERQSQNFPIQGGVADAMNAALYNLADYRRRHNIPFRFLLQIHDAVLLEVPYAHVERVVEEVMPICLQQLVPIVPCRLDGTPFTPAPVYTLGIDTEVSVHWGEKLPREFAEANGIPMKYVA